MQQIDYQYESHRDASADLARLQLARDFPDVAPRIVTAIFTAYRRVMPTAAEAYRAARDRIADAARAV